MTRIRSPEDTGPGGINADTNNDKLKKRWSSSHIVQLYRKPNTSLGISIVGGKVCNVPYILPIPISHVIVYNAHLLNLIELEKSYGLNWDSNHMSLACRNAKLLFRLHFF